MKYLQQDMALILIREYLRFSFYCVFSQEALTVLDQRVLFKTKRLNAMKHTTQTYERRLEQLQMEYQRMKPGGSSGAMSADARARKKEEDAMVVTCLTPGEMTIIASVS